MRRTYTNTTDGFREQAGVLIGERRGGIWHARRNWPSRGQATSVTFDWNRAMAREESRGDVVGFFHTHPPGLHEPSARDDKTMQAWSSCFGKELLCVVEAGGELGGWIYGPDDRERRSIAKITQFKGNWLVAVEES